MPPRTTSATRQQSITKNPSRGVQKNRKLAPLRRSTRSRTVRQRPPSTPSIISASSESLQEPSAASRNQIDLPPSRGRKRRHDSEDECSGDCPGKRPRENRSQPLSKENLDRHTSMDPGVATLDKGRRKRSLSRQSSIVDVDQETVSVRSQASYTAGRYRFNILGHASIFVRPGAPPGEVLPRINTVVQREVSDERKRELSRIAGDLCNDFLNVLDRPSREDDCIEPIHRALSSMDSGRNFDFLRKADWDPSLKPSAPRAFWDWSFLDKPNAEADDSVNSPNKRQQVDTPTSSGASPPAMAPPPTPPVNRPNQDNLHVKTPRPDITAGLRLSTIIDPLLARGLGQVKANRFLQDLQQMQILCSDPTQQAHAICFPPIVIEGKSYATGKPVFEAQNQASVSGSCITNLQHKLAELTESASPGSYRSKAPLAFSICTEGPHFELWVHYTTLQEGVRMYNMNILKACHASLPEGVTEFLVMMDRVMSWASVDFVNDIVEQLALVEKAGRVRHPINTSPLRT